MPWTTHWQVPSHYLASKPHITSHYTYTIAPPFQVAPNSGLEMWLASDPSTDAVGAEGPKENMSRIQTQKTKTKKKNKKNSFIYDVLTCAVFKFN